MITLTEMPEKWGTKASQPPAENCDVAAQRPCFSRPPVATSRNQRRPNLKHDFLECFGAPPNICAWQIKTILRFLRIERLGHCHAHNALVPGIFSKKWV